MTRMLARIVLVALAGLTAGPALAQTGPPLDDALRAFAMQRSVRLVYSGDLVAGKQTRCPAATRRSSQPASAVLACLLDGTGLEARRLPSGTVALYRTARPPPPLVRPATPVSPPPELSNAPEPVTVSGTVTDAATGETLIGAAVYAPALGRGTTTNAYGFYSLSLPPGSARLVASYVGFVPDEAVVPLAADLRRDLALQADSAALGEVQVEAQEAVPAPVPSTVLSGEGVQALPAILGEADLLKALQLRPGVGRGAEGTAGLHVRGGTPDQTLVLLDGIPVYNASHVFGFLSVFNADAVKRVELFTGGFPARTGGRLSSVVDVRLREGNDQERQGHARVGLLSSQALAEGPLAGGRGAYLVAGRRTYIDLIARPLLSATDAFDSVSPTAYFYDLNAKANLQVGPRDRVFLSLYRGRDQFGLATTEADGGASGELGWGNLTGALRWARPVSDRLFAATTLTASDYRFGVGLDADRIALGDSTPESFRVRYASSVRDLTLKTDLDWSPPGRHAITAGAALTRHRYAPGALSYDPLGATETLTFGAAPVASWEGAVYAEDALELGAARVTAGLRATALAVDGTTYGSLEPRLSARLPVGTVAVRGSVTRMTQPLHLLTTVGGLGLPNDLWVPATERIGPERAWQATAGVADETGRIRWSLDSYVKRMDGLVAYREDTGFLRTDADWQDQVTTGDGRSAGLELAVEHAGPRTQAQLAYTLSRSDRRFADLDGGARFPYRYDRTHDLGLGFRHRLSRRIDVSALFVYQTGQAVTLPEVTYSTPVPGIDLTDEGVGVVGTASRQTFIYGPRNGFRLTATRRLDLALDLYFRRGPRPHALSIELYNATNRINPAYVEVQQQVDASGELTSALVGRGGFPIVPSVSYQFSF